jgi:hypothetical protein
MTLREAKLVSSLLEAAWRRDAPMVQMLLLALRMVAGPQP